MRKAIAITSMFIATACTPDNAERADAGAPCVLFAEAAINWRGEAADTLSASTDGPDCASAALSFSLTTADKTVLWSVQERLSMFVWGAETPSQPPTHAEVQAALDALVRAEAQTADTLPSWPDGAAGPGEHGLFTYSTPLPRDTFEAARTSGSQMLCLAAGPERVRCFTPTPDGKQLVTLVEYRG